MQVVDTVTNVHDKFTPVPVSERAKLRPAKVNGALMATVHMQNTRTAGEFSTEISDQESVFWF